MELKSRTDEEKNIEQLKVLLETKKSVLVYMKMPQWNFFKDEIRLLDWAIKKIEGVNK